MPIYEYECDACGKRFEQIRKFADPPLDVCPQCGKGPIQRLMSAPAFQFKGSGWYITDYAKKGSADGSDKGDKGDKGGKTDKADQSDKSDKAEKTDATSSSDKGEKTDKAAAKPAASETKTPTTKPSE